MKWVYNLNLPSFRDKADMCTMLVYKTARDVIVWVYESRIALYSITSLLLNSGASENHKQYPRWRIVLL